MFSAVPVTADAPGLVGWFEIRGIDGLDRCGDAVTLRHLADGSAAVVMVDVAGHGRVCAHLSFYASTHLMALLAVGTPPAEAARLADLDLRLERGSGAPAFVTAFIARLDPASAQLRYASAGHETALLLHADGTHDELSANGPALGFLDAADFAQNAVSYRDGDRLLVVTDGVTESRDDQGRMFGTTGVVRAAARAPHARTCPHQIIAAAQAHASDGLRDDASALIVDTTLLTEFSVPADRTSQLLREIPRGAGHDLATTHCRRAAP
jgi:sigma-B regulation protein RsbU (phosphoserine phosphatase)